MPLTAFDPMSDTFLLFQWPNYLVTGQGPQGLSVVASSEATGAEAVNLLTGENATAYQSGAVGGLIKITWDLGVAKLMDSFALVSNNLAPADGWQFEGWAGVPEVGAPDVDSGPGLDAVVRSDDTALRHYAERNVANKLNISPYVYPETELRGITATIDTTSGNNGAGFIEVCYGYGGLTFNVGECLGPNSTDFKKLSPTTPSIGLGDSATPRMRAREQNIPLRYLQGANVADVHDLVGADTSHQRVFIWSDPTNIDTFASAAFMGVLAGETAGTEKVGHLTSKSKQLKFAEVR